MQGRRVLVVGAGRRATETILPALLCLSESFEILGVSARHERDLTVLGARVRVREGIAPPDVRSADTILVAVPTRAVPGVIRRLLDLGAGHATLMLDTPVLHPRDLGASRTFRHFKEVLASEESVALPPIALARRLIDDGTIGRLRHISLFHGGYRYHALASLRHLAGGWRPSSIRVTRWNARAARWDVRFPGGATATVLEPLRHDSGRMLIAGDRGTIADYPLDGKAAQIGYRWRDETFEGLTLDAAPVATDELDELFTEHVTAAELPDPSLNGQLKIRGFMETLMALDRPGSPFRYPAPEALQDSLSLRLAERLRYLPDPRVGRNRTLLGEAIRAAGALGPATARP
jgi:predicted dehydrogenase